FIVPASVDLCDLPSFPTRRSSDLVLAYCSVLPSRVNLICVLINIIFFSFSIAAYILHGFLQDTTNQFKQPHQLGKFHLPGSLMTLAMLGLIVAELGGTGILLYGAFAGLF